MLRVRCAGRAAFLACFVSSVAQAQVANFIPRGNPACGWLHSATEALNCVISDTYRQYGIMCPIHYTTTAVDLVTDAGYYVEHYWVATSPCGGGNAVGEGLCNPGYYWNDTTKVCTPTCQRQSDCDDGNVCNGTETCGGDGGCQKGIALICDDNNKCTNDACKPDAGCVNTPLACLDGGSACSTLTCDPMVGQCVTHVDTTACMCPSVNAPPVGFMLDQGGDLGSAPCGGLGGQVGAKAALKLSGLATAASCANGCTDTSSFNAKADLTLNLCSGNSFGLTGAFASTHKATHVQQCDPSTCSDGCSVGNCATDETGGTLSGKVSRGIGRQWGSSWLGGSAVVRCGATASLSGSYSLTQKTVTNNADPSGTCADCSTQTASLSGGGGVQADCVVNVGFRGASAELGCKNCASLDVKLTGSASGSTGSCGGQRCYGTRADVNGAGQMPTMKFQRGWWQVRGSCGVSLSGCGEYASCGNCACGNGTCVDVAGKISCSVCSGSSTRSFCIQQP